MHTCDRERILNYNLHGDAAQVFDDPYLLKKQILHYRALTDQFKLENLWAVDEGSYLYQVYY
jgi:hypothetical protein